MLILLRHVALRGVQGWAGSPLADNGRGLILPALLPVTCLAAADVAHLATCTRAGGRARRLGGAVAGSCTPRRPRACVVSGAEQPRIFHPGPLSNISDALAYDLLSVEHASPLNCCGAGCREDRAHAGC